MRKCQERPRISAKETYILGKETNYCISIPEVCVSVERDLFIWQKRPIHMAKETYEYTGMPEVCVSVKRDLYVRQKRPFELVCTAKEAF